MIGIKRDLQCCVSDDVFEQMKSIVSDVTFETEKKEVLDTVAQTFSNDNSEFLKIVEIKSDEDRKKEWKAYATEKIDEIGSKFAQKITENKNEIIIDLLQKAQEYCEQQEELLHEIKNQYDEMLKEKDNPEFVSNRFSEKAVDIAYSKCVLSLLYQNK